MVDMPDKVEPVVNTSSSNVSHMFSSQNRYVQVLLKH